ncbi:hypothetical protein ACH4ZX_29530 [Streptomyces sp. NPDC020490]|uniref:hypothetical protein n=1 Tax=Streptomyces sp. NPDC020490 TaxID=3365078 RepID=UPI0037A70591
MRALNRRLERSLTAQALMVFVPALGITALVRRNEHPAVWVVQSVLYTAIAVAFLAVQRRRAARAAGTDPGGVAELNRKIRRREVPRDPGERAAMRRLLTQHLGQMERGRRWLPYWLGFMGLIAAGVLVLGVVNGHPVFPAFSALAVAGFCYWTLWMRRRSLERCRFMRDALRDALRDGSERAA